MGGQVGGRGGPQQMTGVWYSESQAYAGAHLGIDMACHCQSDLQPGFATEFFNRSTLRNSWSVYHREITLCACA